MTSVSVETVSEQSMKFDQDFLTTKTFFLKRKNQCDKSFCIEILLHIKENEIAEKN